MNKKEELQQLEQRNKELHPIVFVGFKTSEELSEYKKTIQEEIEEYYGNLPIIKKLKWELMTPDEQAKKIETARKVLTKTSSKDQAEILEIIRNKIEKEGGL
nr:hypothetical protein [uncultured Psychroserpens sp.]